ncbi:prephenate dehydrogenase/arogenate dehydrogenase family protein [Candidatus Woesearchaeota archaeon]|nr:prephenate dehydrogenase/arogenate dehydrogenase family protein [Candidatus Woesearchaeota archaeon]
MTERVGIIGGAGAEGSYFADILQKSELEVAISDINVEKARKLCAERGYLLLSSEELMKSSNLALFSLPIRIAPIEIERWAPLANEAIADLSSVKTKAMDAMIKYSKPEIEVFGVHGMYRPNVLPWGQNVLMIEGRPKEGGKWFNKIEGIFKKNRANIDKLVEPAEHDYEMAPLQIEPHSVAYAFLTALKSLSEKVGFEKLQKHSTLFFRLMMDATGRVVSDPNQGEMYGSIQMENPATKAVYDLLISALEHQRDIVTSGDIEAFKTMHEQLSNFLGEYARQAAERTDRMAGAHPVGIQLFYGAEERKSIEDALRGFRKSPQKYKEYLETARIFEGDISKLRKNFVIARESFHGVEGYKEGNFAFYVINKKYPGHKKGIRFAPTIPINKKRIKKHNPEYVRVQMYNRFGDPFLNLFDTYNRKKRLKILGTLVAFSKKNY